MRQYKTARNRVGLFVDNGKIFFKGKRRRHLVGRAGRVKAEQYVFAVLKKFFKLFGLC